ncbi:MAG TPA: TIGR01777 family oxidoreductase, partial [Cyclobacteriaceae bacterium]|nr:TIGR01777 family oxidoreductase [Cyclobacteriaceae bacterium]
MANKILITGASGLIGSRLTKLLIEKGHPVAHLGRAKGNGGAIPSFVWNLSNVTIDAKCLDGIDTIVHLAGANVADGRWTTSRKKEILDSRIKSTALLLESLKNNPHTVRAFISASAIGYYGFSDADKIFKEDDKPGDDFLAGVTAQWEAEVDKIQGPAVRTAKIRIGIVLSDGGGALAAMAKPIQWGVGAPLGSGKQFLSWIHVDDLCGIFLKAIEDEQMAGPYNATSDWCTNE